MGDPPSREEALFLAAAPLADAERIAFLDRECADDPALRARLDALLAAHEEPDTFLAPPAAGSPISHATLPPHPAGPGPYEGVGQVLGRYKLLERLGEGGCGSVYVAEQTEPVRRRVALKVIRPGMDSAAVVARFEAERQALATMDHPNIAKFLDAGTTDTGRPYFVMELVRGVRITEYCDQTQLPIKDRLDLFIKVCQAVQHAHQKGIIHRDIKPSNILVTLHDGVPVPKVIDFGIAKAMEGRLTDATVYTQLHHFLGTPAYMSPEQAEMSGLDIDTRSDIYSLGVLLYELLTGATPFDAKELMASGLDGMRKTIREKEPVRPSTRLTQLQAIRRDSQLVTYHSSLATDLDWIVMKCLEKDRTRRYETVNGVANDLRRHLSNEPVVARPPSAGYRIRTALRRNKLAFGAGAAVALALIAGLGVSVWQAAEAMRARKDAETAHASALQRAIAESEARANEARERESAQKAHARAADLLCQLEIQKAGELFLADKPSLALAHLARVSREYPTNRAVADRLAFALTQISFASPRVEFPKLTNYVDNPNVRALRFSPDSHRFVAIWDRAAQVWDIGTETPPIQPFRHDHYVDLAEFSPDGRWLLTVTSSERPPGDKVTQIWDAAAGGPVGVPITTKGYLHSAEFSPDSRWVLTGSQSAVHVWDARTGRLLFPAISAPTNAEAFTSARFSLDVRRIHTTTRNGVQAWDLPTSRLERAWSEDASLPLFEGARLSPAADRWVTSSAHTVHTWDAVSGRLLAAFSPGGVVNKVEFSPDGQRILTATTDRIVRIWDSGTGQPIGEFLKHETRLVSAAFSGNGQWVLTLSADRIARVWDALTGLPVIDGFRLPDSARYTGFTPSVTFSPDGRLIAGMLGDTIRLWELSMALTTSSPVEWDGTRGGPSATAAISGVSSNGFVEPPPRWFPEVIEAVAGLRLTEKREVEVVPFAERLELRSRVINSVESDAYTRFARWLLTDRTSRTVSPFSATTIAEYVHEQIRQNSLASLQSALRLSPTNSLAMSRLALHLVAQNPRLTGGAEYLSRRALELSSGDPGVWWMRSAFLMAVDRPQEALQLNESATQRFPTDSELWNQRGDLLERGARWDEAEQAYSLAIDHLHEGSRRSTSAEADYLLNRFDARARQGRPEEAQADQQAGLGLLRVARREESPQWGGNDPGRNLYASATGLPGFAPGPFRVDMGDVDMGTTHGVRFIVPLGSQALESPAVARGRILVGTNNDNPRDPRHRGDRSILMCLDQGSGAFLWQLVVPKLAAGKVNDWEYLGLLSTPAVEGNRIYLVTTRGEVLCLTTDGLAKGNVGPFKDEACYAAGPGNPCVEPGPKDADIVWRYDMMGQLAVFPHNGSRTHVLIVGDLLFVGTGNGMDWTHVNTPYPDSPSLIALNKHTGELMGVDDAGIGTRIFHGQWSSPSTGRVGDRQLVFFGGGDGFCYAFDAVPFAGGDGPLLKKVWWADCNPPEYKVRNGRPLRYPDANGPSELVATPVFWRDRVYVAIGQDPEHGEGVGNLVCLDATREGDITETGLLWSYRGIQRSISTAAITPEGLLFISDFSGFVHCVDADTGRPHWVHDMKAHIWGSTLVADGKVYIGDEDGDFVVFAADKEKKILSATLRDGEMADGPNLGAPMYSTPVTANGVLYFNSNSHLFAIEDPLRSMDGLARESASSKP